MPMSPEARAALNRYRRERYHKNPAKYREYMERYWEKKAELERQETAKNGDQINGDHQ